MRWLPLALIAAVTACAPVRLPALSEPPPATGFALVNGLWFDGEQFRPRELYVAGGKFTDLRPLQLDSIVDLRGGYVVPPFGDAHTHNLDGRPRLAALRDAYLREGTFYVQVLTNSQSRAATVREQFNRPGTLDVVYAHGGFTATLSHPFQAYEPFAMGLNDPSAWKTREAEIRRSRILENDAYWFIDRLEDLDAKWPRFLKGEPDLVKIFLLDARNREGREGQIWGGPGLQPALVPEIVRRASAAGLRVAAHVETADDAAIAIRAGAKILAHLPGYALGANDDPAPFVIGESLARLAAQNDVIAMPNASLVAAYTSNDPAHRERAQALQRDNIRALMQQGVRLVVGSDSYGRTARGEFYAMRDLGLWTNAELLKTWAEYTPQSIFPDRKIGRLESGYEASLLVLGCDPVVRLECVEDIHIRIKQGEPVVVEPSS